MRMSLGYKPFAVAGAVTTFDPANKSTFATLSGGNLVITWAGATPDEDNAAAAGTTNALSGKRIFGGVVSSASFAFIGVNPSGYDIAAVGGAPSGIGGNGAVWINGFGVFVDGVMVATPTPFSTGDVAELIYDVSSFTVWFALNGVVTSGDPAAGTGGYTMSANNPQPCAGLANTGSITGNFGQTAFSYSGSGIVPWG